MTNHHEFDDDGVTKADKRRAWRGCHHGVTNHHEFDDDGETEEGLLKLAKVAHENGNVDEWGSIIDRIHELAGAEFEQFYEDNIHEEGGQAVERWDDYDNEEHQHPMGNDRMPLEEEELGSLLDRMKKGDALEECAFTGATGC